MITFIEEVTPCFSSAPEGVDALLQTFRPHLNSQLQHRAANGPPRRLGIRCSVVPISPLTLQRDALENVMADPPRQFTAGFESGDRWEPTIPVNGCNRRSILRGLRVYNHHEDTSYTHELFLDGSQNVTLVHKPPSAASDAESDRLFASWALGITASTLRVAAASARACARAEMKFCVEIEICLTGGGSESTLPPGERRLLDYRFESIATTFPHYLFDVERGPVEVLNALLDDLYNSAGLGHADLVVSVVRPQRIGTAG